MLHVDQLSSVSSTAGPAEIRAKFDEYGYVVVRGLLDPAADLQPVRDEYAALLDRLAREWHQRGELSSDFAGLSFEARLTAVVAETGDRIYDHFRIFFNPPSATTADSPIHTGPAIFGLLTNPRVLDVVECLIGPEIYLNPVNVARIKVPERYLPQGRQYHIGLTAAWWHQDQGVFSDDISDIDMLTVWLPLTDASKEMGCLQVVPGSHKGELSVHCHSSDPHKVGIPELLLGNGRHYVEMKAGDVHFHHRRLQHGSLRNVSDRLRFSFDLRYQPLEQVVGQSAGVPADLKIPGFIARSRKQPQTELRDWQGWARLQEETRRLFMAIDWENNPPRSQFTADHRYCI